MQINKRLIIGILLSLLMEASYAQTELREVQAKLNNYTKKQIPEKVFLHTDKEFYTAGEIIWFKVYVLDGIFHKPLTASKVAYVEVLDNNNTPVWRDKIALNEKGGSGSFQLPLNFHSGYYTIRAYTNWMKNQGANSFFEKSITIVNTLKSPKADNEKSSSAYSLKLFPEGGNLVDGIPSQIAFHVTDKYGKGVSGIGYLLNSENDTLSSFVTYKFGMGHFDLTPQQNITYKVVFKLSDGSTISQGLPTRFENGYTMKLEEMSGDKIKITVRSNVTSGYPEVFLLAHTRQVIKAVQKNIITNGTAMFMIDKKTLGEGVSQFTIFNHDKQPVCERLFFIKPTPSQLTAFRAGKENYASREKVELVLDVPADLQRNMSLSVYMLNELENPTPVDIHQYLWLTSELNGTVEQPAYYFSANNEDVKKATDYLMLTHGWRRFKWETVLNNTDVPKFSMANSGHTIIGKVTDTRTNTTAKDVQVFFSFPNTSYKLYSAVSDNNGIVQFEARNNYGPGEMVIQTYPMGNSNYRVDILSPYAETYNTTPSLPLTLTPSFGATLVNNSIGMQTQHIYYGDSIHRFIKPVLNDTFPFYGQPLFSYDLDKYVRFNTMEEVLREYVREVNVGVKGSGASLRFKLFNATKREFFTDRILVMVDGIPLSDPNQVFSLDPLKIKRIDIIPENYILGPAHFNGLANFFSYTGQYEGLELDAKAVSIDYEGLQLQREFYSPDYSSEHQRRSRLPDLRTTLFWMPHVNTKQVSFYTGDNKGRYMVVLQGIDSNGQTISSSSQIEVQ